MKQFLKTIAEAYVEKERELGGFLFLFPNKRSGTFFNRYLSQCLKETGKEDCLLPEVLTISEFVENLSRKVVCPQIHLLFKLYDCYLSLLGENNNKPDFSDSDDLELSFESYRIWGETVLNDFNIIDQYLVDPDEIFKNIKDYREISSNFLTDEQKDVMEEYFGHNYIGDESGFWKNFEEDEESLSDIKRKFIHLWRLLSPLYKKLNENLEEENLITSGGAYRAALENLELYGKDFSGYVKIVAIGFNALNKAEYSIFKLLSKEKRRGTEEPFMDFFWDATGPVLNEGNNSASRFINVDIKNFPSPEWAEKYLKESQNLTLPKIEIIGAPSNVSQVKIVGDLIEELQKKDGNDKFEKVEVAIVLPDENLLIPALYSIPSSVDAVNLTMGYSFRLSSLYSLLNLIRRTYSNQGKSESEGSWFYHKDIRLLLSHPIILRLIGSSSIEHFRNRLDKYHWIRVSLSEIEQNLSGLADILRFPEGKVEPGELKIYMQSLFFKINNLINGQITEGFSIEMLKVDIDTAENLLNIFNDIISDYDIKFNLKEYLKMYERLLSNEKIMFEGEPLKGLQVMGTLETRALDFDNIYILSMNEGIMPKKTRTRSFIPDSLRRGYGLPPTNYAEELFAYYFYRMISRARKVTLIYDARTGAGRHTGPSRYIMQLRHLFAKDKIEESIRRYTLKERKTRNASILKTTSIFKELSKFCEENGLNLSATALSSYRKCEVEFFLRRVLKLDADPSPSETIDAITMGNIVHEVMMELYMPQDKRNILLSEPIIITKTFLENLLTDEDKIWRSITKSINRTHYHLSVLDLERELEGSSEIIGRQLERMVKTIIKNDMSFTPFKLWGVEIKDKIRVKLPTGRKVNFSFAIDRLDEIENNGVSTFRIIDYKTGSDKLKAASMDDVLKGDYRGEQIFQLFIYAWLLEKQGFNTGNNIMTEIYRPQLMNKGVRGLPKIGKEIIENFENVRDEFSKRIENLLEEIFKKDYFEENIRNEECVNCSFKSICGKG